MDDSVIKVLRRNGSWGDANDTNKSKDEKNRYSASSSNEDFLLDKNFGVLAEEIKKRMKFKSEKNSIKSTRDQSKSFMLPENSKNINASVKLKLLPYLKEVETLINEREEFTNKVKSIDAELIQIKKRIRDIQEDYKKSLVQLQNNINFFDETINLIDKIQGDK